MAYDDRGAGALPKLYGAPAYHRPSAPIAIATPRPFDPDDEPLACARVDGDEALVARTSSRPSSWVDIVVVAASPAPAPASPDPVEPATVDPAARAASPEASLGARLGGLFKGRSGGAF